MNKNLILLFVIFILNTSLTIGQNRFGVFAGYNNSTTGRGFLNYMHGLGSFKSDTWINQSFHIGALYEHKLINHITFRPKIEYSIQGNNPNYELNSNFPPSQYRLSYINMPIEIKFFSKPYIILGPQVGFLISTKKGEADYGDPKNFDYGLSTGVGYDFGKKIFCELNFYQGIQTILIEPSFNQNNSDKKLKNQVIQFSVGYYFN